MSYCRWSSDNWKCDLYCYVDSQDTFITHVASNRVVGDPPHVDWENLRTGVTDAFSAQYKEQMAWLEKAKRAPIGLQYDGETFYDPDLPSFLERILKLKKAGYKVPDFVLESVKEEMKLEAL